MCIRDSLCTECGLRFVGPPASVIDAMGNKAAARRLMKAHGVPVVPGSEGRVDTAEEACLLYTSFDTYVSAIPLTLV